jgi:phosphate transport system substrate-binding protein
MTRPLICCALALFSCWSAALGETVFLSGAGATFPSPLYRKWIEVYPPELGRLVYEPVGSGEGIAQLLKHGVDFGATDAFLDDGELKRMGGEVLHIPTCIGAVVIAYNLSGVPALKFSPKLLAQIFTGQILNWSDPRIAEVNPGASLPSLDITVIHRSEGSGTTFILSDFLSRADQDWKNYMGSGRQLRWPVGLGLNGNERLVKYIERIPGSIGYSDLAHSRQEGLAVAAVQNRAGNFVAPSPASIAASVASDPPADMRAMLTEAKAATAYPICGFSYLIVYREQAYGQRNHPGALALARFLWWAVHEGQRYNESLLYAPLPPSVVAVGEAAIRSLRYAGQPLIDW